MVVYVLFKHTGDGCSWEMEEIEDVFTNKCKAEFEALSLEEKETDQFTSYFVREYGVDEGTL